MKMISRLTAVLISASLPTVSVAADAPRDLLQMGAYVTSDDMTKSEAFYTALLGLGPTIKLDNFIAFDVSGGILAIAKRDVYAPHSVAGSGAVPYIHSTDLTAVQARVEKATGEDAPDIIVEPGIELLKVTDPNGQVVEFFSLKI